MDFDPGKKFNNAFGSMFRSNGDTVSSYQILRQLIHYLLNKKEKKSFLLYNWHDELTG